MYRSQTFEPYLEMLSFCVSEFPLGVIRTRFWAISLFSLSPPLFSRPGLLSKAMGVYKLTASRIFLCGRMFLGMDLPFLDLCKLASRLKLLLSPRTCSFQRGRAIHYLQFLKIAVPQGPPNGFCDLSIM